MLQYKIHARRYALNTTVSHTTATTTAAAEKVILPAQLWVACVLPQQGHSVAYMASPAPKLMFNWLTRCSAAQHTARQPFLQGNLPARQPSCKATFPASPQLYSRLPNTTSGAAMVAEAVEPERSARDTPDERCCSSCCCFCCCTRGCCCFE